MDYPETRLCKRGEATCGTLTGVRGRDGEELVFCGEPAAVAIRPGNDWDYFCREHFGAQKTDDLRERDRKTEG